MTKSLYPIAALLPVIICGPMLLGCVPRPENEVVVYSALDQEFAAPILSSFERDANGQIKVSARFDIESTKTIGLVNRIMAEKQRPGCDLFWNNEIIHTLRLQQAGLLEPFEWPIEPNWPAGAIASDQTWCGFAARARVLIVNREKLSDAEDWPSSVLDLANPEWKGQCGMARPLFGTTATHAAVLMHELGHEQAEALFSDINNNAVILSGNKQVAQSVSSGQIAWGITDTDDAIIEKELGFPVEIVYPDQQPNQTGTLRIPNTLAIIKGGPHPAAARQLAAFLMRAETEERLAMGNSAQIPLFRSAEHRPRVLPEHSVRWMKVEFEAVASDWETVAAKLEAIFRD